MLLLGVHWDTDIVVESSLLHLGPMDILHAVPTDLESASFLSYPCPLIADLSLMDARRSPLFVDIHSTGESLPPTGEARWLAGLDLRTIS